MLTSHRRMRLLGLVAAFAVLGAQCGASHDSVSSAAHEDSDYLEFLEERSILHQASELDEEISGRGVQWREDYGVPEPAELVSSASVWLLYYPGSVVTREDESVIGTWADREFWDAASEVGIELLHTNPVKRAGGVDGEEFTPTIDGWFDRISLDIDPQLGTEEEYREMIEVAGDRDAIVADDLVPLHTGLGPDFWLAARGYKDYQGMYTMVEIDEEDWDLLPEVDDEFETEHVSRESATELMEKGYIPGLIDSADAHPDANNWSGWSATAEIEGADGEARRLTYLHVFKPQQPALNWLDPTYAGRRAQYGDTVRTIHDLGARVVRLDAVPFLGIEPTPNADVAQLFGHPLAVTGTNDLAFMVRKIGGWSFQELNVPIERLQDFTANGPDLSYDFFTRAQVLHPLITGDTLPLRLAHHLLLDLGLPAGTLIHDLQNHDEITYQLVDLGSRGDIPFEGGTVNGGQLKQQILGEMRAAVSGERAPYNKLYRPEQDGIATTFAGFIAPALGVTDPYNATAEDRALIQRGHILVSHANAMQPGVFAISSWDLVGALPVPEESVADRTRDGDWRWVNRGGVDLMGTNPDADTSEFGLPRADALYGPLPEQLSSPDSFASRLERMLEARREHRIHESVVLAVPDVGNPAVCVLVMRLPDSQNLAVTALNYGRGSASVQVDLNSVPGVAPGSTAGQRALDIVTDQDAGAVSGTGQLTVQLDGLSGRTLVVQGP